MGFSDFVNYTELNAQADAAFAAQERQIQAEIARRTEEAMHARLVRGPSPSHQQQCSSWKRPVARRESFISARKRSGPR